MLRRMLVLLVLAVAATVVPTARAADVTVKVNATKTHQTIEGFGTMWTFWAWLPQYDDPAFFDRVVNDLGVSLVRVEIPASLEGANDDADPHHYNWSGFNLGPDMDRLLRFCQEFKKRGVTRFLGDTFSPPGFMKTNRAVNWGGNIRADMWDEYAEFMSAFIILAQKDYGINITDITIQNELLFIEWYASCVYHPQAAREAVRALMRRFKAEGIRCNILMPEDMMQFDRMMAYIGPTMADPETRDFRGAFCTHRLGGYDVVQRWHEATVQYGRESWMTETSGHPQNWTGAMKMASDIYDYIVGGNFSVWVYLRLTSSSRSGGDGLMVNGQPGPKYYAAKQWYRYVRPGAVRVDALSSDPNVLAAAFTQDVDGTLTVVLINKGGAADVRITTSGAGLPEQYAVYRSSQSEGCVDAGTMGAGEMTVAMPAQSIVTLYGHSQAMVKRAALPEPPIAWSDPNPSDTARWGSTTDVRPPAIVFAAGSGNLDRIRQELASGVDVNTSDTAGWTALHTAILEGKGDAVDLLLQSGADVNRAAKDGWTPLDMAAASFNNNRYAIFQRIMAAKPDVNAATADGWTALHAAAAAANVSWGQKEDDVVGRIRDLVAAGAKLEARDRNGRTPLLWAAMQGESGNLDAGDGAVKALLAAGADVHTRDNLGRTPLHYAAEQGYDRIVSALLAAGADPQAKDKRGATPVDLAERRGLRGIVKLLAGASAAATAGQAAQPGSGKLGPELMAAATRGNLAAVKSLLAQGADVTYRDSDGFRAIDRARDHGYDDVVAALKAAER